MDSGKIIPTPVTPDKGVRRNQQPAGTKAPSRPEEQDAFISSSKQPALEFGAKKQVIPTRVNLPKGWPGLAMASWDRLRQEDESLDDFMKIVDGQTTEDYLMDQLVNEQFEVDKDGGIIINKPKIKIPNFHHGNSDGKGGGSGKGQGSGKPTDAKSNTDQNKDGLKPWQQKYGPSQIAQIIGRQFGLPFLEPSDGDSNRVRLVKENTKIVPPGELRRKQTFQRAIRSAVGRAVAKGEYPDFSNIYPERAHRRYKAIESVPLPDLKVAVIYIADVSGSVTKTMRDFTKNANRFVSYPLKYKFGKLAAEIAGEEYNDADFFGKDPDGEGLREEFITYTDNAKLGTEKEFYENDDSGGTVTSTSLELAKKLIEEKYRPSDGWNVYIYHFSDGDNASDDNEPSLNLLKEMLGSGVRYFGHCDLGCDDKRPSSFRDALMKDKELQGNEHIGSVGIPSRGKYGFEDYKKVVQTFLPINKKESEWYDESA